MKRAIQFLGANSIYIRLGYSLSEDLLSRYINYCITFFLPLYFYWKLASRSLIALQRNMVYSIPCILFILSVM